MLKFYFKILIITVMFLDILNAKAMLDCRVVTEGFVPVCNPYGKRLHHVKEVTYDIDREKLIIEKTLPKTKKKHHMEIITVSQMTEKYVKVSPPIRFKGSNAEISKSKTIQEQNITKAKETITAEDINVTKTQEAKEKKTKKKNIIKKESTYAYYTVVKGDSLIGISKKMNMKAKMLKKLNAIKKSSKLRIGQKLKIPSTQKMVDSLSSASYKIESGDTLLSIAKMFKLSAKAIVSFNHIKNATRIRTGKVLKLPLPYVLAKIKAQLKRERKGLGRNLNINGFGTHRLRVTATAYTSHRRQTDSTPFRAAWNNRIRPGMRIIAVSRDMLTRYGMRNGTKVRIGGIRGYYRVRDKMNKRYRRRVDIYMGLNRRRALRWGRRSVVIYW